MIFLKICDLLVMGKDLFLQKKEYSEPFSEFLFFKKILFHFVKKNFVTKER